MPITQSNRKMKCCPVEPIVSYTFLGTDHPFMSDRHGAEKFTFRFMLYFYQYFSNGLICVKVKVNLEQATKAQRRRGIALLFL
jgi:hypothetical protein